MEQITQCPICGKSHGIQTTSWGTIYKCNKERCYHLNDDLLLGIDDLTKERRLNAIFNYIEKYPFKPKDGMKYYWKFYYDETEKVYEDEFLVNVYQLMKNYPIQVVDRIDRILINLSKMFPLLSNNFHIVGLYSEHFRLFYCESDDKIEEITSVFSALEKMEYIEQCQEGKSGIYTLYRISIKGWERIAELKKNNSTFNYGFIAMSFDDDVNYIEKLFKQAIQEAGYEARIIKDKEHNNYIMPEIFYEIQQSKFVVVDITRQNYGAYYEAGYAQALGKEVIVCCKKSVFDNPETKPHFDIAQKSMILWENEQDLVERLKRRIIATVV